MTTVYFDIDPVDKSKLTIDLTTDQVTREETPQEKHERLMVEATELARKIISTWQKQKPSSPERELERAEKLLRPKPQQPALTVGSLLGIPRGVVGKDSQEESSGLTVGSLRGIKFGSSTEKEPVGERLPHWKDIPIHVWPSTPWEEHLQQKFEDDLRQQQLRALNVGPEIKMAMAAEAVREEREAQAKG